jgi:hypothetical protein
MKYIACVIVGITLAMGVFAWAGSVTIETGNERAEMLAQVSQY